MPETLCLSTLDPQGFPDGRMVLLKYVDQKGLVFYTDTRSVKGQSLLALPRASATFYWEPLKRQVRIQGETERVSDLEADAYFKTRPRLSQVGAWVSKQSGTLVSRAALMQAAAAMTIRYVGREIPRPSYWTGFRLRPLKMEFWEERLHRLHQRILYVKCRGRPERDRWEKSRLYP